MYAVVHTVRIIDRAAAEAGLKEIVPQVSGLPGFASGYWIAQGEDAGISVVNFESEESADSFASFLRSQEDGGGVAIDRDHITVGPVLASA